MIGFKDVLKLAKGRNALAELRSVVFDGKSAMTACEMDWVVGVPCLQPALTGPVVVPVDAILQHLAKSRHLVVMPDHLSNGEGLVTPFNKPKRWLDETPLSMLPKLPEGEAVSFDLDLDALDRVLIAAGEHDIRYYLNGVMFDLTHGAMVGSNGHRLHVYRNRVPVVYPFEHVNGVRQGKDVEVIVNRAPLRWMLGSASPTAKMTIWDAVVKVVEGKPDKLPEVMLQTADGFVWVRKAIEGKFPDYQRVLPAVNGRPLSMECNPARLADAAAAMSRVSKIDSQGKTNAILVDFAKGLVGTDKDPSGMPVTMTLSCKDAKIDLAGLDDTLWLGVQADYLQDLADCVTAGARWYPSWNACPQSSLLVVDGDFEGVVMPMRIGGPVKAEPVPVAPTAEYLAEKDRVDAEYRAAEAAQEGQEEPETPESEPCPAAVAAMAAQLVGNAQDSAKKAPKRPVKPPKLPSLSRWPPNL